ncbi:SCO4225 family membrane protein [Nonomuraea longicatena]|uniref:Integral membrane protein n=1 Tax=Nonomuraea longicatena TaxID=83682 RepID=A0ABN1Q912_9ACTN
MPRRRHRRRAALIAGAYLGAVLATEGYLRFVSIRYGTPIGPGIVLMALTLPSSVLVLATPVEGGYLEAALVGCGVLQAGVLWLLLRGPVDASSSWRNHP